MTIEINGLVDEINHYFDSKESDKPHILEKIWTVVRHIHCSNSDQWVACSRRHSAWFVGADENWLVDLSRARRGSHAQMVALGRQLAGRGFPVHDFVLRRLPR